MTSNHYQAMRDAAVAALAIAIMGCNSEARISHETQSASSTQFEKAVAPATGKYEEPEIVVSHDVYA
jgi:ABC-type Fe3+-hydroxamate transport system substrate-binding protein